VIVFAIESTGALGALFLTGLLGSLGHCLGMCGPLVMMVSARSQVSGMAGVFRHVLYHSARIAVYAGLGVVAGSVGSVMGASGHLSHLGGIFSLVLGLGVVLLGLGYLGWLPLGRLEGSSAWLSRAMSHALRQGGLKGVATLGALNGLLPCGLVYSALLTASARGQPLASAAAMVVFGAGTLPALLVVGVGAGALGIRARRIFSRMAGFLIVLIGCQLILRGMAGLGLVPHAHLGGLMLW
jgi:sulfite exporter TauE/SafE